MDRAIVEWDGISPVVFTAASGMYPPTVTTWDGVKFYLMVGMVEGKFLIYAGADGGEEVCKKYKLEVSMENPGNEQMEMVSASELVPVDMIYKERQVSESGRVCLLYTSPSPRD